MTPANSRPSADWRDSLASLLGQVPQAEPAPAAGPEGSAAPAPAPRIKIGRPRLEYQRKGRGGKPATVIYGFACSDAEVDEIARQMRRDLAVGGSARQGEILLQGDCRDRAAAWLSQHSEP